MGFLIENLGRISSSGVSLNLQGRREMISEEDLLKTHSRDMYNYLKSTLRFEVRVPVKRSELMSPDFDNYYEQLKKSGESNYAGLTNLIPINLGGSLQNGFANFPSLGSVINNKLGEEKDSAKTST